MLDRSITICSERQQRVHITLGRLGVHYYDTLIVDFPRSVDRYEHETALIRRHSSAGKYLLNVAQRSNKMPDSKSLQVKRTLHARDMDDEQSSRMNSRARHALTDTFIRPYSSNRLPVSPIQPNKIPVIILFGGGIGGVPDGLTRTGKYDVRVVFEYSTIAVQAHRMRFPHIPVCQYTLGGNVHNFLSTLNTYVKRCDWKLCLLQASPPCRKLSSSNKRHMKRDEMMQLVDWTFSVIDLIGPAVYIVENVKQMNEHLTPSDKNNRFYEVFDLQYYVPQKRERAIVSNIPLRHLITPLSLVPIPASSVLPLEPSHMHIMNRYHYSTCIDKPSLTIVGHAMYMYDPRTDTRTVMPIKHAQVLQGFTYSLDATRYFTGLKQTRLALGDAVPPPFMYACGIACFKYMNLHRQLPCILSSRVSLTELTHVIWPREYAFVDNITDNLLIYVTLYFYVLVTHGN